jgi:hypothetical protein
MAEKAVKLYLFRITKLQMSVIPPRSDLKTAKKWLKSLGYELLPSEWGDLTPSTDRLCGMG